MADSTYPDLAIYQGAQNAQGLVVAKEVFYVETGAATYTGAIVIPAGAWITDIIVQNVAEWTAGTSAVMEVGDGDDPDGFYTDVNVKATELLIGQTISFAKTGGVEGAYFAGSATHINGLYNAAARTITGTIVSVGAGTAGRTRMLVQYVIPVSTKATSA